MSKVGKNKKKMYAYKKAYTLLKISRPFLKSKIPKNKRDGDSVFCQELATKRNSGSNSLLKSHYEMAKRSSSKFAETLTYIQKIKIQFYHYLAYLQGWQLISLSNAVNNTTIE